MRYRDNEEAVLAGARKRGGVLWGAREFLVSIPMLPWEALRHLTCVLLEYENTEAPPGDFGGQKWEGSTEQFPRRLTILYCWGRITRLSCGTLTGESGRQAWNCSTGVSRSHLQASACWMFALRVESGGGWGGAFIRAGGQCSLHRFFWKNIQDGMCFMTQCNRLHPGQVGFATYRVHFNQAQSP